MDAVCLIVGCTWHGIIIVLSLLVLLLLQLLLPAQLDQRSQLGQVEPARNNSRDYTEIPYSAIRAKQIVGLASHI